MSKLKTIWTVAKAIWQLSNDINRDAPPPQTNTKQEAEE